MESVIGHQSIKRRRACVPIVSHRQGMLEQALALFEKRPPRGTVGVHARRCTGTDSLFRLAQDVRRRGSPLKPTRQTTGNKRAPLAIFAPKGTTADLKPSRLFGIVRRLSVPAGISALGLILILGAVGAVRAHDPMPRLSSFSLPADGLLAHALLAAVSPVPAEIPLDAALPSLPLTLSMDSHTVAPGQTLDAIARRYKVRLDTLISLNGIKDVRRIQAGAVIKVPNIDGVAHVVTKGETLGGIAARAGVSILDVADANNLTSQTIQPGQTLFIPGARLTSYDLKRALGTLVIWPTSGRISSFFGYRPSPFTGVRQFHSGLDIVGAINSPIKAAMDGRVSETGYSAIYGNFIILSHAGGYQTMYAHLNKILVKAGQSIGQGATIGLLGTTGYSTGPHLHFGVYKGGTAINPESFLGKR